MECSSKQSEDVEEEYSAQHFRFTPTSFCDTLYNTYNIEGTQLLKDLMQCFSDLPSSSEISNKSKRRRRQTVVQIFKGIFDQAFDLFGERVCNELARVPRGRVLPEDAVQRFPASPEEVQQLRADVQSTLHDISTTRITNEELQLELESIEETKLAYQWALQASHCIEAD